jgi:hypothetical protein
MQQGIPAVVMRNTSNRVGLAPLDFEGRLLMVGTSHLKHGILLARIDFDAYWEALFAIKHSAQTFGINGASALKHFLALLGRFCSYGLHVCRPGETKSNMTRSLARSLSELRAAIDYDWTHVYGPAERTKVPITMALCQLSLRKEKTRGRERGTR